MPTAAPCFSRSCSILSCPAVGDGSSVVITGAVVVVVEGVERVGDGGVEGWEREDEGGAGNGGGAEGEVVAGGAIRWGGCRAFGQTL